MTTRPTERLTRADAVLLLPLLAAAVFATLAAGANWATANLGMLPVGFGLQVTAGTFAAGAALMVRDVVQDVGGRWWVLVAVAAGALLSWLTSTPELALASAAAFAVSELADAAVYTPLRARSRVGGRRWAGAAVASNVVGAVVDTLVFVALVPFLAITWPVLLGQLLGKTYATAPFLAGAALGYRSARAVPVAADH